MIRVLSFNRCLNRLLPVGCVIAVMLSFGTQARYPAASAAELDEYFREQTKRLAEGCLTDLGTWESWSSRQETQRAQLAYMLGLDPAPPKTDLKVTVTQSHRENGVIVDSLHFQSRPGLYVTANLYRPENVTKPLPAILYVCGHGDVRIDDIMYGNKVHYQHHGNWFARNGYVCLMIDSLQLGEIEAIHHGTYRYDMWWWLCRGYTPAGVEAWNCIRAVDYLVSRSDVDADRIGVTGRSGGGIYSWWVAALDKRIRAAVPVAGITDLRNHVVDGCVEGHCDCMYFVNTYRWDYPQLAALVAPRPLLISNSDRDSIFPLDGVVRTYDRVRRVYELADQRTSLGLNISPGPHQDTQNLRVHAFHWFNSHLKNDEDLIERVARPLLQPRQLKVFARLPVDQRNSYVHEWFVPPGSVAVPESQPEWSVLRERMYSVLQEKVFRGWPTTDDQGRPPRTTSTAESPNEAPEGAKVSTEHAASRRGHPRLDKTVGSTRYRLLTFESQRHVPLFLLWQQPAAWTEDNGDSNQDSRTVEFRVVDEERCRYVLGDWASLLGAEQIASLVGCQPSQLSDPSDRAIRYESPEDANKAIVTFAPRLAGPRGWQHSSRQRTQTRRRYYLLGQTLDGMRVWDVRQALRILRQQPQLAELPLVGQGTEEMAGVLLYASLFEPPMGQLHLDRPPTSHRQGPYLLNVTRYFDLPHVVALAMDRQPVRLATETPEAWNFATQVADVLRQPTNYLEIVPSYVRTSYADGDAVIETIAGNGSEGPEETDATDPATEASIGNPFGVEFGPDGALYICEVSNHRVLRFDPRDKSLSVVAGTGKAGYAGDGGLAVNARLNEPYEVRFSSDGDMYFVEMQNHVVRRVDRSTGRISTVAGTGTAGFNGDDLPATATQFRRPHSIAFDDDGRLYIADIGNMRIRRVDLATGSVQTIAGNGQRQLPLQGHTAKGRPVLGPRALYYRDRTLWVALREGHSIWALDLESGRWNHIAGTGQAGYGGDDGPARLAQLNGPKGIAMSDDEQLYVVDTENQAIRQIDLHTGTIWTIAGGGPAARGFGGDGLPAIQANLNRPHGICIGPQNFIYLGDSQNHRVRRLRPGLGD